MASDNRPVIAGVVSTGYSTFNSNTNTETVLGYAFPVEKVREILIEFGIAYDVGHMAAAENETLQEWVDEFMEGEANE